MQTASKSHMPDFLSMTSTGKSTRGQDSMNKPYDEDFLKNPYTESLDDVNPLVPPRLTYDMVKTLQKMGSEISIAKKGLLSENDT